ncbi:MAG: hypothetical protein V2A79_04885 [Planctomycetota bacterium]
MYSPSLPRSEVLPLRPPCRGCWVGVPLALIVAGLMAGCVKPPPPYVPAYPARPAQAHCFDGVPHLPGSTPIILGGACCCTPNDELMAKLHADGVCLDLDTEGLIGLYHNSGVQLATDHQRCNNLCEYGPHVVLGGKCLVPPVPGTRNYEEVVTGIVLRPPPKGKKGK